MLRDAFKKTKQKKRRIRDFVPTVQVHQTCNKELDRFCVGFKDPKVRKQSNLDYSVLKYVFS